MSQKQATLSNGLRVRCMTPSHVPEIERQVRQYFQHGIRVRPGDTVFDVGANIGLFSLLIHEKCQGNVTVYAFEPIPLIYEALHENLNNADPKLLIPRCHGLSNEDRSMIFAFRPNMTTLSSAYGDDNFETQNQVQNAWLRNLSTAPWNLRWLMLLPSAAREFILKKASRTAFESEQVQCRVRRLSDIIRDEDIKIIDLLKIDVEKSELDVLLGIDQADWIRIRQVVMEIHDIENRLNTISQLLIKHGLTQIVIEQERILQGSNVFALFALRPAA